MPRKPGCLALAAIAVLSSGCFGSGSEEPPTPDASEAEPEQDAPADTTMPAPEAGLPEAEASALEASPADRYVAEAQPPVEAGPLPVTVVVTSLLGPESGVGVVFGDGSGQVIATTTTDTTGKATELVPSGSQVTVVMGTPLAPALFTIESIEPGDVLPFYDPANDPQSFQVAIAFAEDAGTPDASRFYGNIGSCDIGNAPGVTTIYDPWCQSQGRFPVLVVAQDSTYNSLGYTFVKNVPVSTDGGVTNVTLPGPWYTDIGAQTIATSTVDASASFTTAILSVDQIASGVGIPSTYFTDPTTASQGNTFQTYASYDDDLQGEANYVQSSTGLSITGIATRGLGDSGTTTIDMSQALPVIDSATVDSSIAGQPTLTWLSSTGSLASADGVLGYMTWQDTNDAGQSVSGSWTLLAPSTVVSMTAPALPANLAPSAPSSAATFLTPIVLVVDADFVASYADLRSKAASLPISSNLLQGYTGNEAPVLPVDGTLRFTAYTQNGD